MKAGIAVKSYRCGGRAPLWAHNSLRTIAAINPHSRLSFAASWRKQCHHNPVNQSQRSSLASAEALTRSLATAAGESASAPSSALFTSTKRLHDAFWSASAKAIIAGDCDAPFDDAAALGRLRHELRAAQDGLEVHLQGEALASEGRRVVTATSPSGIRGGPPVRTVTMTLPTVEDISRLFEGRSTAHPRVEKYEELCDALEKFLKERFYARRNDQIALLAAWGPKTLGDAHGEFGEVGALMDMALRVARMAKKNEDFQFEVNRPGLGKDCLVMPPSNFALLGLKDIFHQLLQGYSIIAVVQPRFFPHYLELQKDFLECGLPAGMLEVLPGITPEADPEVLHTILQHVHRLQFTGSSRMFKSLVRKAFELGNLRLEYAGEVSGLNKVRFDGVSASHPAAAAGAAWAAMGNNGELCTSASLVEFDPATGDTAGSVKSALEAHTFKLGVDPEDLSLDVLLKHGKSDRLEVFTEEPAGGFREWWEMQVLVVAKGAAPNLRTNQSLGHGIYAPSIERAVDAGVAEDASCVYMVGLPANSSAPWPRAGTTGAKLPESVFGGMKTYTYAVAGDHDGVGTVQELLNIVKRRGANWRDQEESFADYELTETAEDLREFLAPRDQLTFTKQIAAVLEVFRAFEPSVGKPYHGQGLVGGEGRSQLVTLPALKPTRKSLLIPRGVGLPENVVKMALLCEMSPLREVPVMVHLIGAKQNGKLQVADPLKSFLRIVEKRLGWRLHWHSNTEELVASVNATEYPPYFYCVNDRHLLPVELLNAVADKCGYLYEGLPSDALSIFRLLSTTQAWTVSCTESQVAEATAVLQRKWREVALRAVPHAEPSILTPPKRQSDDIGGGFGGGGFGRGGDVDNDWDNISESESDSDSEDKSGGKKKESKSIDKSSFESDSDGESKSDSKETKNTSASSKEEGVESTTKKSEL